MSYLVQDIINLALIDLATLKPGATPSTIVQNDCLSRITTLWASWGMDETISNAHYHVQYSLTAGFDSYTVGPSGTLNAPITPVRIYGAESRFGNFRSPMKVLSYREFEELTKDDLGTSSTLATMMAADNSYPNINIRVFPIPATTVGSLYLDFYGPMVAITALNNDLSTLAPGYLEALHWNLAMALLPQYGRQGIDPSAIAANATVSLTRIQALNAKVHALNQAAPAPQGAPQQ